MGAFNFFVLSLCCGSITYKTSIFPTSLLVNFDSNLRTPRGVNLHKALTYRAKFSPVLRDHVTVRLSRLLAYLGSYLWKLVTAAHMALSACSRETITLSHNKLWKAFEFM